MFLKTLSWQYSDKFAWKHCFVWNYSKFSTINIILRTPWKTIIYQQKMFANFNRTPARYLQCIVHITWSLCYRKQYLRKIKFVSLYIKRHHFTFYQVWLTWFWKFMKKLQWTENCQVTNATVISGNRFNIVSNVLWCFILFLEDFRTRFFKAFLGRHSSCLFRISEFVTSEIPDITSLSTIFS